MKTVVFKVEGMTCGGCANSVNKVLIDLNGVQSAEVSHRDAKAEVTFDETLLSEQVLIDAIEEAGFDVVA